MYYLIYHNIFTQYIILYNLEYIIMLFNMLIIHILGNIFSLRERQKNMNTLGEFSAGFLTDLHCITNIPLCCLLYTYIVGSGSWCWEQCW